MRCKDIKKDEISRYVRSGLNERCNKTQLDPIVQQTLEKSILKLKNAGQIRNDTIHPNNKDKQLTSSKLTMKEAEKYDHPVSFLQIYRYILSL